MPDLQVFCTRPGQPEHLGGHCDVCHNKLLGIFWVSAGSLDRPKAFAEWIGSSGVDRMVVVQVVAGLSPVAHPLCRGS
jgi:hypothetical protein